MATTSGIMSLRIPRPVAQAVSAILFLSLLMITRAGDFEAGNALFDQGKFAEAKQHYEKLVDAGEGSANSFYNLANTDYRLGSVGRAMLNYERALALEPRHPEAQANLKLLRERSGAKLPALSPSARAFTSQPLTVWVSMATAGAWMAIFGLVLLVTKTRAGKGGFWVLATVGVAGLAIGGTGVSFGVKEQAMGIVTAKQAEARLAPAESAGVAEALPAGSRVRVLGERGAWIYCELPGAGRGWIPVGMLERVRPERS